MIRPWEDHRAKLKPEEYEREVAALLAALGRDLPDFSVEHLALIRTPDGAFRIDVTAKFTQLGANFLVLVECKDHARPVEREDVQVLADKLRAAGAHKGMLFSTNGFQRGAIEYASSRGIALVRFLEGELTYDTKALGPPDAARPKPPPWADIASFVAQVISFAEGSITVSTAEPRRTEPLVKFLQGAVFSRRHCQEPLHECSSGMSRK